MNLDLLDTNFSRTSHGELILKAHVVADRLEAYPDLTFPEWVHNPPRLRAVAEELRSTVDAAKNGGKFQVQARNEARQQLELVMKIVAQHVVMISLHRNDPSLLHASGFDVKAPRTITKAKNLPPPGQPKKVTVTHGAVSGTVLLVVSQFPPKTALELQFTSGDPSDENSWKGHGTFFFSRNVLSGFEVAKRHFFRGRYHSASGIGPWSPAIGLIVI